MGNLEIFFNIFHGFFYLKNNLFSRELVLCLTLVYTYGYLAEYIVCVWVGVGHIPALYTWSLYTYIHTLRILDAHIHSNL